MHRGRRAKSAFHRFFLTCLGALLYFRCPGDKKIQDNRVVGSRRLLALALSLFMLGSDVALGQTTPTTTEIQQALANHGYNVGTVDGLWGKQSRLALAAFQNANGLPATGELDPNTERLLIKSTPPEPSPTKGSIPLTDALSSMAAQTSASESPPVIPPQRPAGAPARHQAPSAISSTETTSPVSAGRLSTMTSDAGPFYLVLCGLVAAAAVAVYFVSAARDRRQSGRTRQRKPARAPADQLADTGSSPSRPAPSPIISVKVETRRAEPPRVQGSHASIPWIPRGQSVQVGKHTISGGMIYVGEHLRPQEGWADQDNCLIIPSLPVATRADISGQYLDYWPSYQQLTPSSRKAYIDWLASGRNNPDTNIGYVFLYFYGLERRLMLDGAGDAHNEIVTEVERLVRIYGGNRSFQRYSSELLAAARVRQQGITPLTDLTINMDAGTIPLAVKLEMGRVAAAGQIISAPLLLAFVVGHPETRVRTPARRLPDLLEQAFAAELAKKYPSGLRLALPKEVPPIDLVYQAASNSFRVNVLANPNAIPDISQLTEPIGLARHILDAVTVDLEGYSRALGRAESPETPTLSAIARLPKELRLEQAGKLHPAKLAELDRLSDAHELSPLQGLMDLTEVNDDGSDRTDLKRLAQCLGAFGFGVVPDPVFAPRIVATQRQVLVFRQDIEDEPVVAASQAYRQTYLALALGTIVAKADGVVSDSERDLLRTLVTQTEGLSGNERYRLQADGHWLESNPFALGDLRQQLADAPASFKEQLVTNLLPIATADGVLDASEVAVLEKLAKLIGLDPSSLYGKLNAARAPAAPLPQKPTISAAGRPLIAPAPSPAAKPSINRGKLDDVRKESSQVATYLSNIFVDDEPQPDPEPPREEAADSRGLDGRLRRLLDELTSRPEWSKADFAALAKQAGLMPGAVFAQLNDWALDTGGEVLLEGEDPIVVSSAAA